MGLTISRTDARIGIETTPGSFQVKTDNARLEQRSKKINLNMHSEQAKIQIDQSECFASAGLKGVEAFTEDYANRGKQNALEYIAKVVQDGKSLAAIERGGNALVELAKRNSTRVREFGMVTMPSARPRISVQEGKLSFDPDPIHDIGMMNAVQGEYIPGQVNVNITPSKVRVYMQQYHAVNIQYTADKVDTYV